MYRLKRAKLSNIDNFPTGELNYSHNNVDRYPDIYRLSVFSQHYPSWGVDVTWCGEPNNLNAIQAAKECDAGGTLPGTITGFLYCLERSLCNKTAAARAAPAAAPAADANKAPNGMAPMHMP